jgi:[ribosomal protein S5]-alanine N-acetyltransferase
VIETDRLLLRPPAPEDAPFLHELHCDPVAMEFLGGVHHDCEDGEWVLEMWRDRWRTNGCGPFSILRREDGRWLGRSGLLIWDTRTWTKASYAEAGEHAQPELGWALVREHWGQGYAAEAVRAVREWAYAEHGVERLVSVIAPPNARSARLAERIGCTPGETVTLFDTGHAVVWEHPR